jgi:serine/threonine protein kinase
MSTSALPRPLGRYTLLRRLASGGMAEVYLAKAAGAGGFEKVVAIKRAHPLQAAAGSSASSLSEEAKLSASLTHPNIVRTFDLGRVEGVDFIAMEHVEGYDAQHVIDALRRTGTSFPIDLAAHVIAEVCRGLAYAHHHRDDTGRPAGIVHRDVSPQNILLSFAGEVKIADFGIAKTNARRSDPDARVIKGKYFYMSPEQAQAEPLDASSDVFSAGIVLWELLCGRRLHDAPDLRSLLESVRRAKVPRPSSLRPDVPRLLDAIVARATERSPAARFANAEAMRAALDRYLARRPAVHVADAIGSLLQRLPPPTLVSVPAPEPDLPQTRDRVATVSAPGSATLGEPAVRRDLDDGEPTLVGWQPGASSAADRRWIWALAVGAALVCLVAWWLHGS